MSDTTILEPDAATGRRDFLKTAALGAVAVGGIGFFRSEPAAAADAAEMITITATIVLNPDFADEAVVGLQKMVKQVEAKEPGVLAYICNRGVQDRNEILFFEIYENQAAIEAHGTTSKITSRKSPLTPISKAASSSHFLRGDITAPL